VPDGKGVRTIAPSRFVRWVLDLTPFTHVGLVPAQPFRAGAAAIMVGIGLVAAVAAIRLFERRDLLGA
jgi:ABC-2 type transport system permease protein